MSCIAIVEVYVYGARHCIVTLVIDFLGRMEAAARHILVVIDI